MSKLSVSIRAILVGVDFGQIDCDESIKELTLLATSAGVLPVLTVTSKRVVPDAAFYIGSGKVEEIAQLGTQHAADMIIFNHSLTPAQQRNLEKKLALRVLDRTSLILDIFAQRAKSHEGKVQVELAQLQHLATRLVRGWTHLERQKGGIGLRGPGETQLETDRRLLGQRVKWLKEKLLAIQRQRTTQRRSRSRGHVFSISLVGYTNAGKSTLFNGLTKADVYAADQLFATLDTTSRRMFLEEVGQVVISDTVGFIRELPHQLVAAFCATLEETVQADLLLHVVDASNDSKLSQIEQVNQVLAQIKADHIPQLLVWNKIDQTSTNKGQEIDEYGRIGRVFLSAQTGEGMDILRTALVGWAKTLGFNRLDDATSCVDGKIE